MRIEHRYMSEFARRLLLQFPDANHVVAATLFERHRGLPIYNSFERALLLSCPEKIAGVVEQAISTIG